MSETVVIEGWIDLDSLISAYRLAPALYFIYPSYVMFIEDNNALVANLRFKDFQTAIAFVNEVALVAESMNHHPEWSNVYNRVSIRLTTHDQGNVITELDRRLADEIKRIAEALNASYS